VRQAGLAEFQTEAGGKGSMSPNDDTLKRSWIKKVQILLDNRSGSAIANFAGDFFALGAAEDLLVYSQEALAGFAENAWEFFAKRQPDRHTVRIYNPDRRDRGSDPGTDLTIIEIINDDMPFLVDSVMGELREAGLEVRLVLHPMFAIERDHTGNLTRCAGIFGANSKINGHRESIIHIHVEPIDAEVDRAALISGLDDVLNDTRSAVDDWRAMLTRLQASIKSFKTMPPPIPVDEIAEAVQFLEWLADKNFLFLGMRQYAFSEQGGRGTLTRVDGTGLGILNNPKVKVLRRGKQMVAITQEIRDFLLRPEPLIITKANVKSRIHRRAHMDYVGVKTFDDSGRMTGELRIVGLFTSTAYTRSVTRIPFLRRKVDQVISRAGFAPDSHFGKALLNVLESYPRDELFQIDDETLLRFSTAILQLGERQRVRVLSRVDKFDRFVSVLVYVPRERYSSDVRVGIGNYLRDIYNGRLSAWHSAYPEGSLARVHYIIGRSKGQTPQPPQSELEAAVADIIRTWQDKIAKELQHAFDPIRSRLLSARYGHAFSAAYRESFTVSAAIADISILEDLSPSSPTAITFYRNSTDAEQRVALKLFNLNASIHLSQRVPMLENMGFRVINERTYRVDPRGDRPCIYLHDMTLARPDGSAIDLAGLGDRLQSLFMAIWQGQAESDGYNALVLNAALDWRDIAMIRALSRYLRQARIPYSQDYMWGTLNRYPAIAGKLVDLFNFRLDPALAQSDWIADANRVEAEIDVHLEQVVSLDDDRIIRRFVNLINASLRTNFYQSDEDGEPRQTFAFKFDPRQIEDLPAPRPFREIFVYSPRLEGVHMRFGKVARGGLRWSDRPQDFRTEVLGLAKAQQVKNAVIVPVGAKGGFVPHNLPVGGTREEIFAEGIEAYKIFVSSLLSITDNLDGDQVIAPPSTVRHDDDDPYLVVAADKGTATFSDTANRISDAHNFWLSDAFASGGSAGYDHKKMAITARGAWEAVKRLFREKNIDIQKTPISVVGIGDMSGDVFGNGMLLSKALRLVGAFDHRDIFLDPDPDPQTSWMERQRLFELGRSSWQDYDATAISRGGGVFSRNLKSIALTSEVQDLLAINKAQATPNEVIRAILVAECDLLWLGGIGTYVRASQENDAEVGDRANDPIRLTAAEVGAKVIGEGANLGLTQKARIEFGLRGGRCNSDAIDNSAGVNSSDLEVNIKIAFGAALRSGRLDLRKRNRVLASMTDQVAALCLRNNYLQTLSISLSERRGFEAFAHQQRLMQSLEKRDLLDRAVEQLPDDGAMAEREKAGQPLTRAEIGILLSYAKITLFDDLLQTPIPDDPYLSRELHRYFPAAMQSTYAEEIAGHRLRREIISTVLSNSMINRGGATLLVRIADQTGAAPADIAQAFAAVRDAFQLTDLNGQIDKFDARIDGMVQLELYDRVQDLLLEQIVWFLRNVNFSGGIAEIVDRFRPGLAELTTGLADVIPAPLALALETQAQVWCQAGVETDLSHRIARLPLANQAPDIILVSERSGRSLDDAAAAYFAVTGHFQLGRLDILARALQVRDYFDGLALDRALQTLAGAHRRIAEQLLAEAKSPADGLVGWVNQRANKVSRILATIDAIIEDGTLTVSRLAVAASLLSDLTTGPPK
jgi:glutamate dehydrogenase